MGFGLTITDFRKKIRSIKWPIDWEKIKEDVPKLKVDFMAMFDNYSFHVLLKNRSAFPFMYFF